MSTETNKAALRKFYVEVFGQGHLEAIDELIAPNFIDHDRNNPSHDLAGLKQFILMARSAFPDLSARVDDMIAEGDRVVARTTVEGTHRGEFLGASPTGAYVNFECIDILRCVDGKAVEHWSQSDDLSLLQQLGVLSAPSPV